MVPVAAGMSYAEKIKGNDTVLIIWFSIFSMNKDLVYHIHSKWFKISKY